MQDFHLGYELLLGFIKYSCRRNFQPLLARVFLEFLQDYLEPSKVLA